MAKRETTKAGTKGESKQQSQAALKPTGAGGQAVRGAGSRRADP